MSKEQNARQHRSYDALAIVMMVGFLFGIVWILQTVFGL